MLKNLTYVAVVAMVLLAPLLWLKYSRGQTYVMPVGFYKAADIGSGVKKAYWNKDSVLQLLEDGTLSLHHITTHTSTNIMTHVEDFVLAANGKFAVAYTSAGQMYRIDTTLGGSKLFYQTKPDVEDVVAMDVSQSANVLVFHLRSLAPAQSSENDGIYLMTIDGAKSDRITDHGESPCLGKDGQRIYFVRTASSGENKNSVYELNLMTNKESVVFSGRVNKLACSKNAALVAFENTDDVSSRVYVYDTVLKQLKPVYYLPSAYGILTRLWWSLDDTALYLQVQRSQTSVAYKLSLSYEKSALPSLAAMAASVSENEPGLLFAMMGPEASQMLEEEPLPSTYVDVSYLYQPMSENLYFVTMETVEHTLSQPTERRQRFYFTFYASPEKPSAENLIIDTPTDYFVSVDKIISDNYMSQPQQLSDLNSVFADEYKPLSQILKDVKISSLAIDEDDQMAAIGYLSRESGVFLLKTSPGVRTAVQVGTMPGELNLLCFFRGRLVAYYIDATTKKGNLVAPIDPPLDTKLSTTVGKLSQAPYVIMPPRVLDNRLLVPVRLETGNLSLYKYIQVLDPHLRANVTGP